MGCWNCIIGRDHGSLEIVVEEVLANLQDRRELAEAVAYRGHVARRWWLRVGRMRRSFSAASWRRFSESTARLG